MNKQVETIELKFNELDAVSGGILGQFFKELIGASQSGESNRPGGQNLLAMAQNAASTNN